ncbi:MAG: type I restriction-modification system subunit M N-terminal domain-containing protein [Anaerococcus sp.]|nr:type I restriction-modification system subunit M N-terminal domain-containing protein [Anaerococcus sp.]
MSSNISDKSNFIWKIADILRGDYKQHEYEDVILPFTVLKRLDRVLIDTHDEVVKLNKELTYKNKAPFYAK